MSDPIFRLEGVIKSRDEMGDFEGPLTLILQLLSKNKVEIRDISVSRILEQYLAYLDGMAEMDIEIASEFVAMASHLVYIKTKMLLAGDKEVSELDELISSLEELRRRDVYMQIKAVTDTLGLMYQSGSGMMVKQPEPLETDMRYQYSHDAADLLQAVETLFNRELARAPVISMTEFVYPRKSAYPASQKAAQIIERLRVSGGVRIDTLFRECGSRSELVASFVAILELCKQGSVSISGGEGEWTLNYTGVSAGILFDEFDEFDYEAQ